MKKKHITTEQINPPVNKQRITHSPSPLERAGVRLLGLLFIIILFSACTEDFKELNKGHDILILTASTENIELQEIDHSEEAISLTWTTGTNHGTGNRISYILDIAEAGTGFANGYSVNLGNGVYSWTRTVQQFNTLLKEELGINYNETVSLEARISAVVTGFEEAQEQTSTITFSAKTYEPVTTKLYMVGDALTKGNIDNPTAMELVNVGQFEWVGTLTEPGSFKFIITEGEELPSYNRDASATGLKLVYRTEQNQPDEGFTVEEEGTYRVQVDLLRLTVIVTESDEFASRFDEIFFVGNFTRWNFIPMIPDVLRTNLFHYGEVFEWIDGGEFKFGTQRGWDDMFFASVANAPYTDTEVIFNNSQDTKWLMKQEECGIAYKIALDITKDNEKMIMKPFTPYDGLYLVGEASPNGWYLANATEMTQSAEDPYVFTWTGMLNTGELKISCDKQSDFNGAWFMADKDGKEPTGTKENTVFVDKSDDEFKALYPDVNIDEVDMKWNISQPGNYTITIDQLRGTIIISQ